MWYFLSALLGALITASFYGIKDLLLASDMPDKPTRPNKPQIYEVHIIFENTLCTEGDDRFEGIFHSLHSLHVKTDLIMGKQEQLDQLIQRLSAATNEIAADLQKLRDELANTDTVSAESLATLDSNIATLEQMGQDPADPIPQPEPAPEPTPDQPLT